MEPHRILPRQDDPDTGGFFAAAAEGRLVCRKCNDCGHCINPPRPHCNACGGWNTDWADVRPVARLSSWTVVTHQLHPAYPTPYTLVLVQLEDEPEVRMIGSLPGAPPLTPGMRMEGWFEDFDGAILPQWRPVEGTERLEGPAPQ